MKTKELIDLLRQQAKEIADANIPGWGNAMMLAAERLEELEAKYGEDRNAYKEEASEALSLIDEMEKEERSDDVLLTWDKPMTSKEAAKYLLTRGFVAIELYRNLQRRTK